MKVGILKERKSEELRVAASPETVKKLTDLGAEVVIESDAGAGSFISDSDFKEAGAIVEKDPKKILASSDIILKVNPPFEKINSKAEEVSCFKKGALLVSLLNPLSNKKQMEELAKNQINAFSLELIPRITRAQSMDVLSSQSNLAGYRAVLDAVYELNKVVPMMMTAAGTVTPAKVLILGAGVAGLQAIATAKRLGAVVSVFDVRPVVKEQVESLGATFIEVEQEADAETKGGYAKEMSEDYKRKQNELIAETIKTQDIVITTALIPGKPAPVLIDKKMVKSMKPGSVIVDLATVAGGNCEYSQLGKVVKQDGVTIVGYENLTSRVAKDASLLYAKNVFNFLSSLIDAEKGKINIDLKDEIIKDSLVTYNGKVVHPLLSERGVKKGTKKKAPKASAPTPKKVIKRKPHLKKQTATTRKSKK